MHIPKPKRVKDEDEAAILTKKKKKKDFVLTSLLSI